MLKVSLEAHDAIAVLRINNGVTNAISPELVHDLSAALKRIKDEFKGMVLAGGDKFFCIGLVDAVFSAEDLDKEAIAKIAALAALPSEGLTLIKNNCVEAVRSRFDKMRESETDGFLNCWFNPSVQELLRAAAGKF